MLIRPHILTAVILPALFLLGCASADQERQAAIRQCHAVGVTERDPQEFDLCTRANVRQAREDRLNENYYNSIYTVPEDRRLSRSR